ncbi:MAG: glycosyltransferase family 39 protein [Anaerolineae bacterium]
MRKLRFAPLVLILLLATAVRLWGIQAQSIWFDEGWSAYAAAQPTPIDAWRADATNPPLYYVLINLAARGFGTSELALRYLSLLLGVLAIPLVYQLARRLAGERAGVYAALLAAASAPLWWAAQEARMYTLLALLILICALAWQRILTSRRAPPGSGCGWRNWRRVLYAHYRTRRRDLAQRRDAAGAGFAGAAQTRLAAVDRRADRRRRAVAAVFRHPLPAAVPPTADHLRPADRLPLLGRHLAGAVGRALGAGVERGCPPSSSCWSSS